MQTKLATLFVALCFLAITGYSAGQDEKKRGGTIVGKVIGQKNSKDDRNTFIDVLAPGEEKARAYHVVYDPKIKGPIPSILKAVRAAKPGETVEIEWVETGHGPAIKAFQVLRKATDKK